MNDISIEDFRGGTDALDRMAHAAWRDEYGADSYPNLYSPDYLSYLMQGVDDPRLAIAAYDGEEIVGFLLNLPRMMRLRGELYRAALSCLLVTRKQYFRQGLANSLISEGLRRNEELKFDFTLFYLETGHRSSRLFRKLQAAGMPIERVKRMGTIARVLDLPTVRDSENVKPYEVAAMKLLGACNAPPDPGDPRIREAGKEDVPAILRLLNSLAKTVSLARVFEEKELEREIICPPLARTLVFEKDGDIKGVLAYVLVEHVGEMRVPWAWINHVYWGGLSFRERVLLVKSFMAKAREQGAAGVVEWQKNTYPVSALYGCRFVPYPRKVDMMAWRFRKDISLSGIPDVYEVQI